MSQATAAVAKLTLEDKVNLGTGVQWEKGKNLSCITRITIMDSLASSVGACVGNTPAIANLPGFNGLCLEGLLRSVPLNSQLVERANRQSCWSTLCRLRVRLPCVSSLPPQNFAYQTDFFYREINVAAT